MKIPILNRSISFATIPRHRIAAVVISYFILHTSYLLSGCQYTIDGNPDVNLIGVRVSPVSATVATNGSVELSASVEGEQQTGSVTWSVVGTGNGTIVSSGLTATYTAPGLLTSVPMTVIVRATSNEDGTRFSECPISVISPPDTAFDPSPIVVTLLTGASFQFTIDTLTTMSPIPAIKWSKVSGPGTITDAGFYTAPTTVSSDNTPVFIKAASASDPTNYTEAAIYLLNSSDSLKCFTRDILPILSGGCGASGCHGNGSSAGGYDLQTYSGAFKSVKPGNARGSRLYTAITQFNANSRMPPAPQPALTPNQVLAIGQWINEGAQDCQ